MPAPRTPRARFLAVVLLAGHAVAAQPQPDAAPPVLPTQPDTFDDRPISEIVVRQPVKPADAPGSEPTYGALDPVLEQLVLNQIRSRTGSPYSRKEISDDITRINRLARFRQVDVRAQLLTDGSVRLYYSLVPQNVIADVQLSGNKLFSDTDIAQEVDILVGTPIDDWELDRAARRIENMYRTKGYYLARVRIDRDELAKTNVVLFEITEGERTRVREIRFEGNKSFAPAELKRQLRTREYFWPLESGPLDEETIDADVGTLLGYYRDRGHLNARVDRTVQTSPDAKEAAVTFIIDEDVPYTLRNIEIEFPEYREVFATEADAREFAGPAGFVESFNEGPQQRFRAIRPGPLSNEQIMGHMLIKPGDVYSADKLNKSTRAIEEALGKLGYAGDPDAPPGGDPLASSRVRITRRDLRDDTEPRVDVLVVIRGVKKPYLINNVIVQGNHITQDPVIRNELGEIKPGYPLDSSQLDLSVRRVEQTQLFRPQSVKITVQKPDPEEPDARDVLVTLEETNTAALTLGGIIGSDGGATAQISFRQRNFDIKDTPDTFSEFFAGRAFRGAGQVFTIDVLPGTSTQNYQISLSEPHLLDSNIGGGISAYYRSRDYRREYDESRLGSQLNFTRTFGDRWRASLPVRIEQITLSDIDTDAPRDYFAVEDDHLLATAGMTFTRTTLDDLFIPTKGNKLQFGFEQAAGGDFTYSVLAGEAGIFIPLYEDFFGRRTVLSMTSKVRYSPQDEADVPVYERFFLGGSSMRGFAFRTVSPRGIRNDTGQVGDDPVGGTFSFNFVTELKQPVFEDIFSVVFFSDSGTVNNAVSLANYRVSVGVGVRLKVDMLSPVPLAFDFGFPIIREDGDRRRIFTFNVDIPFN